MRVTRRGFITTGVGAAAAFRSAAAAPSGLWRAGALELPAADRAVKNGRLKQSVSRWPYSRIPLPEFCRACKGMGIVAIDLLQPEDWPVVRDAGLICSMGYPTKRQDFIPPGFNDPMNHPMLLRELETTI